MGFVLDFLFDVSTGCFYLCSYWFCSGFLLWFAIEVFEVCYMACFMFPSCFSIVFVLLSYLGFFWVSHSGLL